MDQHKNAPMSKTHGDGEDGDNVFFENRFSQPSEDAVVHVLSSAKTEPSIPSTYSRFLFDPRDIRYHSGSGHRRNPSYDSRDSTKSVSDCSYVSGSPCESPGLHELSLQSLSSSSSTPFSSTGAMAINQSIVTDINPFHSEKDFVDYLLTLPPTSSKGEHSGPINQPIVAPPAIKSVPPTQTHQGPPQIGLDHLENLCKLMEQLGELREHNSKLQKRVQYLEEMRNLNELRQNLKEVLEEAIATSPKITTDNRNLFAFGLNEEDGRRLMTKSPQLDAKRSPSNAVKLRQSSSKRRSKQQKGRSQSMGDDDITYDHQMLRQSFQNSTGHKAKVSKWAKVKEALKWERVQVDPRSSNSNNSFYVDNNDGGHQCPTMISKATVTLKPVATSNKGDSAARFDNEDLTKQKPAAASAVKYLQKTDTMREIIVPGQMVDNQDITDNIIPICPSSSKEMCYETETSTDEDEILDLTDPRNKRRSLGSNVVLGDTSPVDPTRTQPRKIKISKETTLIDEDQVKMRKGRSLERNVDPGKVLLRTTQSEKENKKLTKGAWGKVKTILQTRKDSLKRKHRKSACLDASTDADKCINVEGELYTVADDIWLPNNEESHVTTVRTESDIDTAQSKSKNSSTSSNYALEEVVELVHPDKTKPIAKATKPPQLTIAILPEEPFKAKTPTSENADSSPNCQSQTSKWTKVKKVFHNTRDDEGLTGSQQRPQSVPASPSNVTTFRYEDLDFLEEYFRETKETGDCSSQNESEDNLGMIDPQRRRNRLSVAEREAPLPVTMSSEVRRHLEDMQRNVTEDFTKKMQEWERLKNSYSATKPPNVGPGFHIQQQPQQSSPRLDRKCSSSFSGQKLKKTGKSDSKWEQQGKISKDKPVVEREHLKGEKQREKELQWLEKQLQKIEREKQRLAKERQKYLEREARLEKMRESMMKPATDTEKKEILIKTSAGEFRFQGISETFTRKLHEWETMRGIGPEVSTLTLLGNQNQPVSAATAQSNSSMAVNNVSNVSKQVGYDYNSLAPPPVGFGGHFGRLTERNRSHSESSLANMANVQTSTTSLVMRPDDILNMDFINDNEMYMDTDSSSVNALSYSRANSEPEIAFNAMLIEGGPCAMEVEQMHFEESIPCLEIPAFPVEEPVYSYAPVEVTQLIDSSNSSSDVEREIQIMEGQEHPEDQTLLTQEQEKCPSELETNSPKSMSRQNAMDKDSPNYDGQLKTTPTKVKLTTVAPVCMVLSEEENAFFKDKWERQDTALERPKVEDDKSKLSLRESHSKKKDGVNKVKEISAELIQQAKTLEQTLLEKNVTIRQLQWELLQREMSNKRFQSELEKVTGQAGLLAEGPASNAASKGKSSHQRSWSAVETVHAKRMEQMEHKRATANQSPLELLKITEKTENSASPIGLARKVDELKSELKYLWGSQESNTNSICSELTTDKDPWTINRSESSKEKTSSSVDQSKEREICKDEDVEDKRDSNNSNKFQLEPKNNVNVVAIRRVSDTVIPPYIQSNINNRISKLPMSPQMNRSKSLSQNSTPTTSRKAVQNISQMSPETTARSSSHSRIPAKKISTTSPYLQRQMCMEDSFRLNNVHGTTASSSTPIKLSRQKKLASYKESCQYILRRQNAEDYASTSDTDSDGSNGVTFTVNLEAKKPSSTDSPKQQRATTSVLVESPSLSRMKPPVTTVSNVPWRRSSKDEEIIDINTSDFVATDEQLSAPSTPIVRSRSTRKLKPPTTNKSTTQSGPEASSTSTVTQLAISPLAMRRGVGNDNTAPNVRLMIEKFNRRVNEVNNPALSSPNMSTSRSQFEGCCVSMLGVKKSTSFTDAVSANYAAENSKSGFGSSKSSVNNSSVIKSASTSVIEKGSRQYCSKPPLSPEVSTRKVINSPQQPVGIASRIPRCLTAICEQDSIDKENSKVDQTTVDICKENNAVNQQKFGASSNSERIKMQQTETGNPKIGTRALEIKRAKEIFLTKSPSTTPTSPNQPQAPVSSGWRAFYQRSTSASSHNSAETPESTDPTKLQKLSSNVTAETSLTKPKSILKHNRGDSGAEAEQMPARRAEPAVNLDRWSDDQQLLEDDDDNDEGERVGGGIVKCASAGAVDFAVNYGLVSTSEPRMSTQSSTDSSDKHQKSTCGLFSFRFRRPKKQKKPTINTGVQVEQLPAVKTLCRQSLLVDIDSTSHDHHQSRSTSTLQQQSYVSTSVSPATTSSISCPSSPEARPKQNVSKTSTGLWQNKPRTIFKSK